MRSFLEGLATVALVLVCGAAPAHAAVVIDFTAPFAGNPDENLLFNDPGLTLTGTTIEGLSAFEANLNVFKPAQGHASGTVMVTAIDRFGVPWVASSGVTSQGSNFFNVLAIAPDLMRSILIETTVNLEDVRQIRVGGIEVPRETTVPEPAVLLLFRLGLVVVARRIRCSQRAE
jgi:hypothetical protein